MVLLSSAHRAGHLNLNVWMPEQDPSIFYEVFLEAGIISQLSRVMLEARLPEGLLQSHFSVLSHLIRAGDGSTPLAIANAFQVPKNTMTHTLKGLESLGLIELASNPDDGRSKFVYITNQGKKMYSDIMKALVPEATKMVTEFDVEKLASILPTLKELRKYLDDKRSQ